MGVRLLSPALLLQQSTLNSILNAVHGTKVLHPLAMFQHDSVDLGIYEPESAVLNEHNMIESFWNTFFSLPRDGSLQSRKAQVEELLRADVATVHAFPLAWGAHTVTKTGATSWKEQLNCLILIECLCERTSFNKKKSSSPFFPVLVSDALDLLRRETAADAEALDALLSFVESILPDILDSKCYDLLQQNLSSGGTLSPGTERALQESIEKWINIYHDDGYVSRWLPVTGDQKGDGLQRFFHAYEDCTETLDRNILVQQEAPPSLKAPFVRPLPPPLLYQQADGEPVIDYLQGELIWLTPTTLRLMLLPDDEDDGEDQVATALSLLQTQAFEKPLAPAEQRTLLQVLSESTEEVALLILPESGLTAQTLPRLVEHNPLVAYECLVKILTLTSEDEKNEYLSSLVGMDMSLHTLEVVNRLAMHPGQPILHAEYIHLFIGSCIASCENIPDRHAQNRLVRLVCIFVQSLLRNNIIQVEDIFFELQSFCVEFSRIREAAALFKSLKEVSTS